MGLCAAPAPLPHYENRPIQVDRNSPPKTENYQIKTQIKK